MSIDGGVLRARACASTYTIFAIIAGIIVVPEVWLVLDRKSTLANLAIMVGLGIAVFVWIAAFKLEVQHGLLKYRTLFRGTRSIALSDIQRAEVTTGATEPMGPFFDSRLGPL